MRDGTWEFWKNVNVGFPTLQRSYLLALPSLMAMDGKRPCISASGIETGHAQSEEQVSLKLVMSELSISCQGGPRII